jgi:hypothetical protein
VEDSGDGVGIGDDLEDTHAAAAFTAAGDVEREDAGEELCPGDAPGSGRGRGRRFGRVEVQRELWRRRRCGGPGDDALAQAMVAGEHTVIAGHVEAGRRDQGAEAGEELVGVHVGVGGAAAPGRLEGDTDAAAGERRDGVMGEGRAQEVAGAHTRLVRAYECGDLCIDLQGCPRCQVMQAADLTAGPVPGVADDSAVVFVSCVLEYVSEPEAALRELQRMAGASENLFLVLVEPWSLTAALYPGARWTGGPGGDQVAMKPVTVTRKVATAGGLLGLLALAVWPRRR